MACGALKAPLGQTFERAETMVGIVGGDSLLECLNPCRQHPAIARILVPKIKLFKPLAPTSAAPPFVDSAWWRTLPLI